ncbi:hypothetical protein JIR001_06150 [Polycladomyces abyssicola]|uniref:Uncharacterized protein n=1 Tax=Polycladomyces abyssicola TaxID=1125966 RepID=A0A8D5UCR3_9BACL|nr:hypothetical protein [Polycladomyces abyssicola]BCU80832.1 hypothetical protein JIR001_06150 [Polycladomyces abyssicola]
MANDLAHLVNMAKKSKQQLVDSYHKIKTDPTTYWDYPRAIANRLETVSFKDLLVDKNVPEFKKKAYLFGKCWEAVILVEPYNHPESPRYSKTFRGVKISVHRYAFYWALASEHQGLIESLAHLMGYRGEAWEKENGGLEHVMMGFVIKYLLLRDDSRAESYLVELEKETQRKKQPQYWYTYVRLLRGIWEGDQDRVQELACKLK